MKKIITFLIFITIIIISGRKTQVFACGIGEEQCNKTGGSQSGDVCCPIGQCSSGCGSGGTTCHCAGSTAPIPTYDPALTPCCNVNKQPACGKTETMCYQGSCYPEFHCWFDSSLCGAASAICTPPTSIPSATKIPTATSVPPSPTLTAPAGTPSATLVPSAPPANCLLKNKGDADCDGKIGLSDFTIWKTYYDTLEPPVPLNLNANFMCSESDESSRFIDLIDFEVWRRNWHLQI